MTRATLIAALMALGTARACAQTSASEVLQHTTFGGYVIAQVNATDQARASRNSDMSIRLARLYVDSRLGDVAFKLQMQVNGNSSTLSSPRVLDAWAEWQRWAAFRLKAGQMKRCFTFENPQHPWLIGFGAYSQLTDRLAGFNDRTGEHPSNGRDFGIQVQGDVLPVGTDSHSLLHYQAGVYNGQGTNHSDRNSRKDVIGGLTVSPWKPLQVGLFGWRGDYVHTDGTTLQRRRMSVGVNYVEQWLLRAEWAVDAAAGRADAWYVAVGTPPVCDTRVYARWDVYREGRTWSNAHSICAISAMHTFHKNLALQLNYGRHLNKLATNTSGCHYNTADVQLYWRF